MKKGKSLAHHRLTALLQLATDLQATTVGLTYDEIIQTLKDRDTPASKRTVQRMLNGLLELGLNYEQDSDENILNQDEDHHLVKLILMF